MAAIVGFLQWLFGGDPEETSRESREELEEDEEELEEELDAESPHRL